MTVMTTVAAPPLEATTATIALVAVLLPLLLVATGKPTSPIVFNSRKHSAPTKPPFILVKITNF